MNDRVASIFFVCNLKIEVHPSDFTPDVADETALFSYYIPPHFFT